MRVLSVELEAPSPGRGSDAVARTFREALDLASAGRATEAVRILGTWRHGVARAAIPPRVAGQLQERVTAARVALFDGDRSRARAALQQALLLIERPH